MPKKSTPARSGVQRTRPKAQKSFELVRPTPSVQEVEDEEIVAAPEETTTTATAVDTEAASSDLDALPSVPKKRVRSGNVATEVAPAKATAKRIVEEPTEVVAPKQEMAVPVTVAPKGSAAARLAATKSAQRSKRNQATLITAEHYSYVRRDLLFIAILAIVMFAALIVIYFTGIAA